MGYVLLDTTIGFYIRCMPILISDLSSSVPLGVPESDLGCLVITLGDALARRLLTTSEAYGGKLETVALSNQLTFLK